MLRSAKYQVSKVKVWLRRRLLGAHVSGLMIDTGECVLLVDPADRVVGRELRVTGRYGEEELRRIEALVTPQSTVAFIGTHVGALAIPATRKVRKAYMVEANPRTFALLEKNLALNAVTNAVAFNVAVGEGAGEINFVLSTANSGGSKREPQVKAAKYYYDRPQTIRVPMVPFDTLVDPADERFDLVLMDIEGSEYFALKGMQTALSRTETLIVEFIGHHLRNVAGVSVAEFLAPIESHFSHLYIPTLRRHATKSEFLTVLSDMYDKKINDDGLVFSKSRVDLGPGRGAL
ncbi:MAG: FkbM family methyltransferase [Sinobacteraceae bacterium]|nr:FkbM family methyltransferase [Nevskiaceae bacterium]